VSVFRYLCISEKTLITYICLNSVKGDITPRPLLVGFLWPGICWANGGRRSSGSPSCKTIFSIVIMTYNKFHRYVVKCSLECNYFSKLMTRMLFLNAFLCLFFKKFFLYLDSDVSSMMRCSLVRMMMLMKMMIIMMMMMMMIIIKIILMVMLLLMMMVIMVNMMMIMR
jgi:hypothetical protein